MIKCVVIANFRGACASVKMLKGYMVRERLGSPAFYTVNHTYIGVTRRP